jgi:uncharacterized protein
MLDDTAQVKRGLIHRKTSSQPYWDASRDQRLLVQYCPRSGQYQFFPRPVSIATGLADVEWREVDGKGEVYSYSATYRGLGSFRGHEPYLVVIVRLDVGVDVVSNLVGCDMSEVAIGMRVEPHWLPLEDGTHLLQFQPALALD